MKLKILIVEDDPMVAHIHSHYLTELKSFDIVKVINNGQDAYEYIKNHNDIDLVILDVHMPKMNGLDLLKALRKEKNNISVIPITAINDNKTISEFLNLGVIDYLVKPFTQDRFNKAVYRCELKYKMFAENNKLSQRDIDQMFSTNKEVELPKGLQESTLDYIISRLKNYQNKTIVIDEISEITNLSKVSLRKYLDYLVDFDMIEKRIDYGTVGRPKYLYFIKELN